MTNEPKWETIEIKRRNGLVEIYRDGVLQWSGYPPPQWVPPDPPGEGNVRIEIDEDAPEDFRNLAPSNSKS